MSINRIIARRMGAPRKVTKRQKLRPIVDELTGKTDLVRVPYHVPGSPWWCARFADLVERRSGRA